MKCQLHLILCVLDELAAGLWTLILALGELLNAAGIISVVGDQRAVEFRLTFRISFTGIDVTHNILASENNINPVGCDLINCPDSLDDDSVVLRAPGGEVEGHEERPAHHHHLQQPGDQGEEEAGAHVADGAAALLYQGDGDQDPLAEEDEHADHHQEDDPGDGGEGHPRVPLLEEVLRDGWCPVQLRKD